MSSKTTPRRAVVALLSLALALSACGAHGDGPAPEPVAAQAVEDPEPAREPEPEPEPDPEPVGHAPLTGEALYDEEDVARLADRPAAMVKIPNDPSARPQTGLDAADVVYEQETEAGVVRFAAVFHSRFPDVVGNVRSARAVDVALAAPFRGVMVYSGARASNRERIGAAGLTTVTEGGTGFFRDGSRRAPHNLYVRLPEAVGSRTADPAPPAPWRFAHEHPEDGRGLEGPVTVPVSRSATTTWTYDADAGAFLRGDGQGAHAVAGGGRVAAANVVVLDVDVQGRDSHGAPLYVLEGGGDALLLRDGRAFDVAWAKEGLHAPLQIVDGANEAVLAPGPTWVLLTYDGALDRVGGLG